jgi:L-amino acid N-acyltransferase YncA
MRRRKKKFRPECSMTALPRFVIRPLVKEHWPQVLHIYVEGIATGNATFETEAPSWERWDGGHLAKCRLVAEQESTVLGWAALSPVSPRCVYGGVAEVSVYVAQAARGKGVGKSLLSALIDSSENAGLWTLQAGIFPENTPSIAVHKSLAFREVGRRQRIGKMGDTWRDVVLLERRSAKVGL